MKTGFKEAIRSYVGSCYIVNYDYYYVNNCGGIRKEPHIPLMIGTAVAIIVTMLHGYEFSEVEEMMYKGIRHALPAIVIIILVGLVIGSWIGSGVVATMIYYGLQLIDPRYF